MSAEQLDKLVADALKAIRAQINRSAGQQLRRYRDRFGVKA